MSWLERRWYGKTPLWPLLPLASLYGRLACRRRRRLSADAWRAPVPVIVVGNISVGGTGKTPLTQRLCGWLRAEGWRPGIVSRGYGGRAERYPLAVSALSRPEQTGDEPLLLALTTGCPVVVDPDRPRGVRRLLEEGVNIVVSDDGLQHYRLARDVEIAVVDGERGLGNGALLPAGPLREPPRRLQEVDHVVVNGEGWSCPGAARMELRPQGIRTLQGEPAALSPGPVHAVAGIGNPGRFFSTLRALGFDPVEHPLPDHHPIRERDLVFDDGLPVVMTAKDAVKCRAFAKDNRYYLDVGAELPDRFFTRLSALLAPHRDAMRF